MDSLNHEIFASQTSCPSVSCVTASSYNYSAISVKLSFDTHVEIPPSMLPSAEEVKKLAGTYLHAGRTFGWESFKKTIDNYEKDDLAFDEFNTTTIAKNKTKLSTVIDSIITFILESSTESIISTKLESTLRETFTSLKAARDKGSLCSLRDSGEIFFLGV